jgi:APA family basic amino acid/polyamine antiporter
MVTAFMMYYLVSERPVQSLIGVLMMAAGLALYFFSRTRAVPDLATPT